MSTSTSKVALITGGSTGIGKAVAFQLAQAGITVVIAGRDQRRGESAAAELTANGATARFIQTDVRREPEVENLVRQTLHHYGRIDYLFNNAGTEGTLGPLETTTEAVIDEVLATNIKGVLLSIKQVLPVMREQGGGMIINTASFVGTTLPLPAAIVYGATKAAVISITQSVAAAGAADAITVFAVCPWVTDTPMVDRLTGHQPEAKAGFGASINPSGQIATTDDIAGIVCVLFGGRLALASGEAVLVDSGGVLNKITPHQVL
jgi:NAD(P)-dependent dehydrogenase (short-subunit alcohol dehydrogenase family)